MTVIDDLASAYNLLVDGSISQQEFNQIKRELLEGLQPLPAGSPSVAWVVGRILLIAVGTILVLSVLVYWFATRTNSPESDEVAESDGELAWSREEQVLASRFGNTTISTDAQGRKSYFYYNRDRSFKVVSHEGVFVGKWWVEDNKTCFKYDQAPTGTPNPSCARVSARSVGDTWTTGKGAAQVTTTIVQGIRDAEIATDPTKTAATPVSVDTLPQWVLAIHNELKGIQYSDARQRLLKRGWRGLQASDQDTFGRAQELRVTFGYDEVRHCAGSGRAPCAFLFESPEGQRIEIVAIGEIDPQTVDGIKYPVDASPSARTVKPSASASVTAAVGAETLVGTCLLKVDNKNFIDGSCKIELEPNGSFKISTSAANLPIGYFAVVFAPEGTAYWNEELGSNHAHTPLGDLRRKGACWENERAKVCAWR